MSKHERAIGIFSGSFNPVHNGHLSIARSFLSSDYISRLWILLTPDPPHKEKTDLVSFHHRYRMLKLAFAGRDHIRLSDIETKLPKPSYTLETLKFLTSQHPKTRFYLCIGEDSARNFKKWHKWKKIITSWELLIARRTSDNLDLDPKVAENSHIIDHEPVRISSTEIREKISNKEDISQFIPDTVEEYIQNHNLYSGKK